MKKQSFQATRRDLLRLAQLKEAFLESTRARLAEPFFLRLFKAPPSDPVPGFSPEELIRLSRKAPAGPLHVEQ